MARRKRPQPPSDAEILKQLRANVYALLTLQSANAKGTEDEFGVLTPEQRETVKTRAKQKFSAPRPDQIERQRKQKRSRGKNAHK